MLCARLVVPLLWWSLCVEAGWFGLCISVGAVVRGFLNVCLSRAEKWGLGAEGVLFIGEGGGRESVRVMR